MKNLKIFGTATIAILVPFLLAFALDDEEQKISEKEVPAAVLKAFKAAYPTAKPVGYTREKENGQNVYEIEFKDSGKKFDAIYTPEGKLLILEQEINMKELPEIVLNQLKKEFKSFEVEIVEKISKDNLIYYELVVEIIEEKQEKEYEILFDADGKLLEREEEKENEEQE